MILIDAIAFREQLEKEIAFLIEHPIPDDDYDIAPDTAIMGLEIACADLGDMPEIDAEPVKHGFWKHIELQDICSICGFESYLTEMTFKYCPYCGAKMDGGTK